MDYSYTVRCGRVIYTVMRYWVWPKLFELQGQQDEIESLYRYCMYCVIRIIIRYAFYS